PQPGVVGEEDRDTPLADAIEDEERLVRGALHHDLALRLLDVDHPEPAAPMRGLEARSVEIARYRVAFADIADAREEGFLDDLAGRRDGQDGRERRVVETAVIGVVGAGGDE